MKKVFSSYLQLPLLLLCIGAGLRQGSGLVWAYNAKAYFRFDDLMYIYLIEPQTTKPTVYIVNVACQ